MTEVTQTLRIRKILFSHHLLKRDKDAIKLHQKRWNPTASSSSV